MLKKIFVIICLMLATSSLYAGNLSVFVSILPQKFFAEKLLGKEGNVEVLIGAGQTPHTYEPLPQQMGRLAKANAYFAVGVPFEKALISKLSSICPSLKIVYTDADIEKREMKEEHSCDHDHMEGNMDPHFWLNPNNAYVMARNMAKAIVAIKPELDKKVNANLESLKKELGDLDKEISEKLVSSKGRTMLVFHPAFGYFTDRYGLIQKSVEIDGKEPAPKQLADLIRKCKKEGIKTVFVQKQFPISMAETIALSIKGKVVVTDPLGDNYVSNLKNMTEAISASIRPSTKNVF